MKILRCLICDGEIDLVDNDRSVNKKVRCRKCGFCNSATEEVKKETEVIVIRRRG